MRRSFADSLVWLKDRCGRWSVLQFAVVAGVWAWSTWQAFAFVAANGVSFPYFDEWEMIPVLTGQEPITLSWLWSQHNEHRIFLARLAYLLVERLADCDFRAGMFFNAGALSVAAAALVVVARRNRGRTEFADAFFPLILLNLGQAQTFTNAFQIAFVSWTILTLIILVLILHRGELTFRWALALGCCVALEPLMGGPGVTIVPALAIILGATAWQLRSQSKRQAGVVLGFLAVAVAITAAYFIGYKRPPQHPKSHDLHATLEAAIQFLITGFGGAARLAWPAGGWLFALSVITTAAAWAFIVRTRADERSRALRLGLYAAALVGLAVVTAWARSALGPDLLFASRYAALAVPFWCAIYFMWDLVDRLRVRQFGQLCLCLCAALLVTPNREDGAAEAVFFRDVRQRPYAAIARGVSLRQVILRHHQELYYGPPEVLAARMKMLRSKKIGVFKLLKR